MVIMHRSAAEFWWKIKVPKDVIYYWHDGGIHLGTKPEWKTYTRQDHIKKKTEKQEHNIALKRNDTITLPCIVQVFQNHKTTFFSGWWIYIITKNKSFHINFRHHENKKLVEQIMQLYPMGCLPMYSNFDLWAERFSKAFPHVGFGRKKHQGIRYAYCTLSSSYKYYNKVVSVFNKKKHE